MSTPDVAAFLVEQPPDERLRAGRVAGLTLEPLGASEWAAGARLAFARVQLSAGLVVARDRRGRWRVIRFEPGI
jgi:hypothetical protein